MAERESIEIEAEPGEEIVAEVPGEDPKPITLPSPGTGPADPIQVLSRLGGVTLRRRDGTLLHVAGRDVKELLVRVRQRSTGA